MLANAGTDGSDEEAESGEEESPDINRDAAAEGPGEDKSTIRDTESPDKGSQLEIREEVASSEEDEEAEYDSEDS